MLCRDQVVSFQWVTSAKETGLLENLTDMPGITIAKTHSFDPEGACVGSGDLGLLSWSQRCGMFWAAGKCYEQWRAVVATMGGRQPHAYA